MGEGFSVLQGTKTQSSLYGLQVFVTQQGGKRPGQMVSNGWEYSFLVMGTVVAPASGTARAVIGGGPGLAVGIIPTATMAFSVIAAIVMACAMLVVQLAVCLGAMAMGDGAVVMDTVQVVQLAICSCAVGMVLDTIIMDAMGMVHFTVLFCAMVMIHDAVYMDAMLMKKAAIFPGAMLMVQDAPRGGSGFCFHCPGGSGSKQQQQGQNKGPKGSDHW